MKNTASLGARAAQAALAAMLLTAVPGNAQSTPDASTLPPTSSSTTTTTDDFYNLLVTLGMKLPDKYITGDPSYLSRLADPYAPANAFPRDPLLPEGNWRDPLFHTVERGRFGEWTTYEDPTSKVGPMRAVSLTELNGNEGGAIYTGGQGDLPERDGWQYTPLHPLKMQDGTPVTNRKDWETKRRPEIYEAMQAEYYGRIPDKSEWPSITWTQSAPTFQTTTSGGFSKEYRIITVTGTVTSGINIAPSGDGSVTGSGSAWNAKGEYTPRNPAIISLTVRTPMAAVQAQRKVGIIVGSDYRNLIVSQNVPDPGIATASYSPPQGSGSGQQLTSFIIGMINRGNWRKADDWGSNAAAAWGFSRFLDYTESAAGANLFIDSRRSGVQGVSRGGKQAFAMATYDDRVLACYPASSGAGGAHVNRRQWGETHETIGGSSEYQWMGAGFVKFSGSMNGGFPSNGSSDGSLPRNKERMTVDGHIMVALKAPRIVFINGGTDTPAGNGEAWQDPRGMYLAASLASPAYELIGRKGLVIPDGTHFTTDLPRTDEDLILYPRGIAGESFGGTPNYDLTFIEGHLGFRRQRQGHTGTPGDPAFVELAARFMTDWTPPELTPPDDQTIEATGPDGAIATWKDWSQFPETYAPDNVDDFVPVDFDHDAGSVFPVGTTVVKATATDVSGNKSEGSFNINVVDTTAPVIQSLSISQTNLWPPNHKMIALTVSGSATDIVDTTPVLKIVSVTSNEPVTSADPEDKSPDWVITGNLTLQLRAERLEAGSGRLYTVTVEARDDANNASTSTVTVWVPKTQK